MSLSATIALSPSTVKINQQVNAVVTVTSTEASSKTITSIQPYAIYTGATAPMPAAVAYGTANLGPNSNAVIAASGTATFPLSLVFFAPSTGLYSDTGGTYTVSATCMASDGTVFASDSATVTVNLLTDF